VKKTTGGMKTNKGDEDNLTRLKGGMKTKHPYGVEGIVGNVAQRSMPS